MNKPPPLPPVRHNEAAHRFEAQVEGGIAHADYRIDGAVMRLTYAEVPRESEGLGLAAHVVRSALDYADAHGLAVLPMCSYARSYMRRHPETHGLLPPGTSI